MATDLHAAVKLFGCWRSTCTHRVTLALSVLGIPFDYCPVNLDRREQDQPAFRALAPEGQVPVLQQDGRVLTQSMAILTYLDALRPEGKASLFPEDPFEKAEAIALAERVSSFIQPFLLPGGIRRKLIACLPDNPETVVEGVNRFVRETLADALESLDRRLAARAGPFALGDRMTLADLFIFAQLVGAARMGIDVNGYPRLSKLYEAMERRADVRAADPSRMPDAPGNASAPRVAPSASALPQERGATPAPDATRLALAYKEPAREIAEYLDHVINTPIIGLDAVRHETFRLFGPVATKVSAIEVCRFLRWTASQMQARRALEVGVFTGSSSLALLEGMGTEGRLDAIDISSEYTAVARQAWANAGMDNRVNLVIEDGITALDRLPIAPTYDIAYVDALNEHYQAYHQRVVPLMKPGGLIVFDNILWKGRVIDPDTTDPSAIHLRDLNLILREDRRLETTFVSMGDGLALCKVL